MTRRWRAPGWLVDGVKIVLIVLPAAVWFGIAERPLPLLFAGLLASAVVGYLVGGRLADRRRERALLSRELVVPHWPSCMVPGCELDAVRFMAGERWYCAEHGTSLVEDEPPTGTACPCAGFNNRRVGLAPGFTDDCWCGHSAAEHPDDGSCMFSLGYRQEVAP